MNRYDQIVLKFLVFSGIPIILLTIFAYQRGSSDDWFNTLVGFSFMGQLLTLIYVMSKMIFVGDYREFILTRIFQLKSKDEREEIISGQVAKKGHLFMIAIILAMLFISVIKVSVYSPNQSERDLGKKGTLSIGIGYSFFSAEAVKSEFPKINFDLKEMPLSKEGILTMILALQLFTYHFHLKRKLKD